MVPTILGIGGSLRDGSLNHALLNAFSEAIGSSARLEFAPIGQLPHYNADLDGSEKPPTVAIFIEQVKRADALLFATPEFNYGIPGVLKNAIDWVSRPAYRSPLAHKPTAILGASMSPIGTARAQAQLRQILAGTITPIFPHPEFLVGVAHTKFNADGKLIDSGTEQHLAGFAEAFLHWAEQTLTQSPLKP